MRRRPGGPGPGAVRGPGRGRGPATRGGGAGRRDPACRTGFAPGDRAGIIDAIAQRERDPGVNADVPWAMAGPSGADPVVRHYSHDAWNSASATIRRSEERRVGK